MKHDKDYVNIVKIKEVEPLLHMCSERYPGRIRSSHRRCSIKKVFLKDFAKFTRKDLCQSLPLNKVAGLSLQLY